MPRHRRNTSIAVLRTFLITFAWTAALCGDDTPDRTCPAGEERASPGENRLSDDETKEGWTLVFNGKNLDGFQKPTRDGKWSVKNGILVGTGGRGVLGTKSTYDDFELKTDARISDSGEKRGNSGVFIRSSGLLALRGRWPDGHEIQLDNGDPTYWTGAIWKTAKAKKVSTKDGEWFRLRIEAKGPRVRVWVNEVLVTEYQSEEPVRKGPLSFQVHHPTDVVEFKNVKVRELR